MSALLRAFNAAAAAGAEARATFDTSDLAGALAALYKRGRDAYPSLRVAEASFGRAVGRCAGLSTFRSLEALAAEDLYLACACAEGVRGAAAAFEAGYAKAVRRAVARVVEAGGDREDAEQRVRQHLLVGTPGAGPAVAKYPGHLPLAKWIPVVAIRLAISQNRTASSERRLRDKAGAEAMGVSPEDMYMKAELKSAVEPAVSEALGRLAQRDRLILRLYLVAGMSTQAIGTSLDLSHQAVSKRLAKAREILLDDIRRNVASRLNVSEDEFSSLMRVVASQLDVNISRLLHRE
jgi:RNA polymerase sigma-70 factor (ECF subfamily)